MLNNLKAELVRRQITQKALAEMLGIAEISMRSKISGERPITESEKHYICEIFGMPFAEHSAYLFEDVEARRDG